jgi:hypothetical protein
MYLAVVAAKELPKLDSSTAFAITTIAGGKDKTNVTAKALADVSMEKAADNAGAIAFASDETVYAKADIAFKLGEAKYQVRDYETIAMDTTQANLANMMEIKTLGDITGFTFIGAMNPGADWTTADVTALTFTPTYTVTKITDTEVAISGGYKQIQTAAQASAAAAATAAAAANTFKTTYADILAKTTATVTYADLGATKGITAALTAYEALDAAAKALLADEKELLDDLKEAAETPNEVFFTWSDEDGGAFWLGADTDNGFEGVTAKSQVTSFKINDIDLTAKVTVAEGWVGVSGADWEAAGGGEATSYEATAVINGKLYTGSFE